MRIEAFGVRYAPLKGPEWVLVGVAIVAIAVSLWEGWEARSGNYRPLLRVAAGIIFSFLGGTSVERGIVGFRAGATTYSWSSDFLIGIVCVALSIHYIIRRKDPRSVIEWLNERNKPLVIFEKKDD
jgi:hypothetical protein